MKRSWRARGSSPLPSTVTKMPNKTENGRPRIESAISRTKVSTSRRSRSPRRKKSSSPAPKRGTSETEKRPSSRSSKSEKIKSKSKKRKMSSSTRSKSPPSRRMSKEKLASYCTNPKDSTAERATSHARTKEDRFASKDKYLVDRPSFRGPDKDVMLDRDSLKKIVVNMRDTPVENDSIKRDIVNAEDITVVRRAATSRRWQYQNEMDNWHESVTWKDQVWDDCYYDDDEDAGGNTSEGSRPIFDRDEIKNNSRKYDEDVHESRRIFSGSPPHSGRRPCSSERFRHRDSYYEDRSTRNRDTHVSRFPPRDFPSHSHDRLREERSRFRRSRSRERSRELVHDRRDRYEERDYRRSRMRGRSHTRSYRRHPSPVDYRRVNGRRLRSSEREIESRRRDQDVPPDKKYPSDYPMDSHGYYEGDAVEGGLPSPPRGGSHLPFRGRGSSVMPMVRAGEVIVRGAPPVRPVRAVFLPRVPPMARRLPFPPRLIRPIVRPVIRVIAPVIPVRSPSVIPVRHPVIPLPFQCEAFR